MLGYADKMKEMSRQLFKECKVEMVIGFRQGSLPMMNEPCFVKSDTDVDQLVWDSNCGINLANYLTDRTEEKIGIFAKGCDSRNIVTHIIENKIKRGAVGHHRSALHGNDRPAQGQRPVRRRGHRGRGRTKMASGSPPAVKKKTFTKEELLQDNCRICAHKNPVIHDEMLADPVAENQDVDRYADIPRGGSDDARGEMAAFRRDAVALYPLLCLSECLSALLLPDLFCG